LRILAVDQSKAQTGICRIDSTINDVPCYRPEKFKVKANGTPETLCGWYDQFRTHIEGLVRPDFVVYETPTLVHPSNMILYQIAGVMIHTCAKREIPLLAVHNQTLKRWAGISGSEKPIVYAKSLLGYDYPKMTADEADAIVLAEIGWYVAHEDSDPGTDLKREIVATLRMTDADKAQAQAEEKLRAARKLIAKEEAKAERDRKKAERMAKP